MGNAQTWPRPTILLGGAYGDIRVEWDPPVTHWIISTNSLSEFSSQAQLIVGSVTSATLVHRNPIDIIDIDDIERALECLAAYWAGRGNLGLSDQPLAPYRDKDEKRANNKLSSRLANLIS